MQGETTNDHEVSVRFGEAEPPPKKKFSKAYRPQTFWIAYEGFIIDQAILAPPNIKAKLRLGQWWQTKWSYSNLKLVYLNSWIITLIALKKHPTSWLCKASFWCHFERTRRWAGADGTHHSDSNSGHILSNIGRLSTLQVYIDRQLINQKIYQTAATAPSIDHITFNFTISGRRQLGNRTDQYHKSNNTLPKWLRDAQTIQQFSEIYDITIKS